MNINEDDVAVIGMSGRFPGASSLGEFWQNLCAKKDCIQTLSDTELREAGVAESDIADSAYVKASALVPDVDKFDPEFFKISPLEAELMDPQIRLLLQCAWETLEDAGHASMDPQKIGVFAGAGGVTTSYLANFINVNNRFEKITAGSTHLGNDKDFLATYISYKLNLTGPSLTVQTACSTSLVALHQARASLLNGECDMALAGGVTVRVPHVQGYRYQEGYIFSRSGRVRAFDEAADGVVFGSGLGLVMIRRLSDAIADGDNIYAVIRGSAIGNDGKGKMSYAASSAKGQIACARAALKSAGVDAGSIGLVESHGTGTAMGDPEEVKALSAAFKADTGDKGYCALGAVKANIGHLEAAAGIVGFIKAVLAVKHGLIPPMAHFSKPNRRISFDKTPFYVNTELQEWEPTNKPRRAAVNSLGVGGTNAFVILENYAPADIEKASVTKSLVDPVVVPLSARSEPRLRDYAARLARFLDAAVDEKNGVSLESLAYTLQVGRVAMNCRVAFAVASIAELRDVLGRYLQEEEVALPESEVGELARSWSAGNNVDWSAMYAHPRPTRISLPTYAFAKDRYWIDPATNTAVAAESHLHPLLHTNSSDLDEQKYSATFTGSEFFLDDHRVRTRGPAGGRPPEKILPGVAYLEMARAAVEHAAPNQYLARTLELRDLTWLQPVLANTETSVQIALVPSDRGSGIDFEVFTGEDRIHCQGKCRFVDDEVGTPVDLDRLKQDMQRGELTADAVYSVFTEMGLEYGPAHRSIERIQLGRGELLAQLVLPEKVRAEQGSYQLHPSLLDGAFQAATTLLVDPDDPPSHPIVPFALESLRMHGPCTGQMLAWARFTESSQPGDSSPRLDLDLFNAAGSLCVQIRGFLPRSFDKRSTGSLLATRIWEARAATALEGPLPEQHVLLCGLPQIAAIKTTASCASLNWQRQDIADLYSDVSLQCFEKLQTLIKSKPQLKTVVQIVLPDTSEGALCAGLVGLLKTAHLENPLIVGQILLVNADTTGDALARLLQREARQSQDTLIKYEREVRYAATWQFPPQEKAARLETELPFKEAGVYVITGGLGGLGALFAREILDRCPSARIVLTGRGSLSDVNKSTDKKAVLEELRSGGSAVEYRKLDLTNPKRVDALVASLQKRHGQLDGIIHSAGMIADDFILKKSPDDFRRVLAPKVEGTVHLDRSTQKLDLDFFVLFSSLTSAVGNPGQADYAAANGFLDEFAAYRNRLVRSGARRGATLAIRWPLWREGGMQLDAAGREALYETAGVRPMRTTTGMRMFYRSLALGYDQTLVMAGDIPAMKRALQEDRPERAEVVSGERLTTTPGPAGNSDLNTRAEAFLCSQLATLLKLPAQKVNARAPLEDYGIDSILALDLTRLLEKSFGPLPKTLFFEYLTIAELAAYFARSHAETLSSLFASAAKPAAPDTAAATVSDSPKVASIRRGSRRPPGEVPTPAAMDAIAIVGLSGRYPKARDLRGFWRNLRDGLDCIEEVPQDRWNWRDYYSEDRSEDGRHFSKWGGFIEGVDEFDARFFNISPAEAETIDPQERLFLEHAWLALEDAGYTRAALQIPNGDDLPAQVGVYAGVMYNEYQLLGAEASLQGSPMGFASNVASIANRVSYFLNLHGPSMAVDTMCSSSLTAIHLACQDLKLGRTALAIAGGVNVTIHPNKYLMLSAGQFISSDGHCQSFGEGGDGYIPGEGVGVVLLKRLAEAERDGDHIYGVIRGSALSHGGKTNGYTVPNPQAQASAIRQALSEARVEPRHVSYIEAHGTGTKLGDPIEIAALSKVFQERTADTGFCLVGSAKSNIGHAEAAAGIAGLTKVLLQLKHKQLVPSLHSSRLNPHIDFGNSPFVVNQALRPWEPTRSDERVLPRVAGISSFGAGGSNVHLVVEEYPQPQASLPAGQDFIFPLSARTPEQLRQKAQELVDYLEDEAQLLQPASVAYTLQTGREAMDQRLAVVADSVDTLVQRLGAHLQSEPAEGVVQGQVKASREEISRLTEASDWEATLGRWIDERELTKLAELWAKGLELDWRQFHNIRPPLISLPGYPFARQRYWIDPPRVAVSQSTKVLHPLLHRNISNFERQGYASHFTGTEPFLAGESGQRHLTEAACMEMARAAVELSMPTGDGLRRFELRDLAWAQPPAPVEGVEVTIELFGRADDRVTFEIYSAGKERETVHCQGHLVWSNPAVPPALDLAAIKRRPGQVLIELQPNPALTEESGAFGLDLGTVQNALTSTAELTSGLIQPLTMGCLRLVGPEIRARFACIRRANSAEPGIDIDLCDQQGRIAAQIRGIEYQGVTGTPHYPPTSVAVNRAGGSGEPFDDQLSAQSVTALSGEDAPPAQKRASVALATPATAMAYHPQSDTGAAVRLSPPQQLAEQTPLPPKPRGIALPMPGAAERHVETAPLPGKPRISLAAISNVGPVPVSTPASAVSLFDHGEGVYAIRIEISGEGNELTAVVMDDLLRALRAVEATPAPKVLMLHGKESCFLAGGYQQHSNALATGLYAALVDFPCPTIAVVRGDARGAGFLIAAVCDFMVCCDSSHYAFANPEEGLYPAAAEDLLAERLGRPRAANFLYCTRSATGAELREQGWSCPILPADQVSSYAQDLAAELAAKPGTALGLLKKHLARDLSRQVQAMPPASDIAAPSEGEDVRQGEVAPASEHFHVRVHGRHSLVVSISAGAETMDAGDLLTELTKMLMQAQEETPCRVVILESALPHFLPEVPPADVAAFGDTLLRLELPVIAAIPTQATGSAWYAALCCDLAVYGEDGRYAAADFLNDAFMAGEMTALLSLRLGCDRPHGLLAGTGTSGSELRSDYGVLQVCKTESVLDRALVLADRLAAFPRAILSAWKQRNVQRLEAEKTDWIQLVGEGETSVESPGVELRQVQLESNVISATAHPDGVLEVRMADRDARNMFSEAFSTGMREVFALVENSTDHKVVVLTGYDSYFSSGGTLETLLAIHDGKTHFTDNDVFQLPLTCSVPVIAAMQGHGIGAGWALGMYADLTLFSDESRYVSPYMGYGFTPGAGSTLLFPRRIGHDLARETLLTAREYSGGELQERGLRCKVLPRNQVVAAALEQARGLARYPRQRLIDFKRRWADPLRSLMQQTFERELEMHRLTFVGQAETLATIQRRFAQGAATTEPGGAVTFAARGEAFSSVTATLRKMLADELRMPEEDIDEEDQFVDLGLDSVTGVTWIRKINDYYGTSIEAIKVYSYPTLAQLSRYVQETAEVGETAPIESAQVDSGAESVTGAARTNPSGALPAIMTNLRRMLADELRMPEDDIEEDEQFVDLGLDSITGVTWIRKINDYYGTAIEAIKVYSYPTLRLLAGFVREEAGAGEEPVPAAERPDTAALPARSASAQSAVVELQSWRRVHQPRKAVGTVDRVEAIAVVGMAGRFPKARDLEEFWQNIAQGRDCIDEIPKERWDIDLYFQEGEVAPGKTYSRWMGTLDDYDKFDADFFNISPREARSMDPQQRLFLQACWHGIEHAGYNPKALAGSRCGVFVGCSAGDYHQLSRREQWSGQGFTGAASSILAARTSYFLDLQGPSLAIDTACSSSLVAVANACDSLASGGSDMALAGGVNVMATPAMQVMTAQVGMLSPLGRCFTFDERASGIVNGEGVGVVVLKRLADAERDGDCIYGVIEGWGVNQDGRTNGITAPNADSQTRLQREIYDRFGINPADIQLVEAHGTGTALGDPMEVAGLKGSFRGYTEKQSYCALGSVKSNIGHCLTAAGVSGMLKALLAIRHEQLPPTLHFRKLNPHIALDESPFYVNDRLREWRRNGAARRAAVNSFGFGGTNAHLVLAEYERQAHGYRGETPVLVPLSARTFEQLQRLAQDLDAFLARPAAADVELSRVAYTLQTGREPMKERVAFVATSVPELRGKLQSFIGAGDAEGDEFFRGRVGNGTDPLLGLASDPDFRNLLAKWIGRGELPRLADLWVRGLDLDWSSFYGEAPTPKRVGLPGYPFARQRHWIDAEPVAQDVALTPRGKLLHPLLHANTSDLTAQQYTTTIAGDEFFLIDCDLRDSGRAAVLPASACLEMIRAALADAVPELRESPRMELRHVAWGQPVGKGQVSVALSSERGGVGFGIFSDGQKNIVHCRGFAVPHVGTPAKLDIRSLQVRLQRRGQTPEHIYDRLTQGGIHCRPALRAIKEIHGDSEESLVHLVLPDAVQRTLADFQLHPALMEAALQAASMLPGGGYTSVYPASAVSVKTVSPCTAEMFAWVRPAQNGQGTDIDICDSSGSICAQVVGLRMETEATARALETTDTPIRATADVQPAAHDARTARHEPATAGQDSPVSLQQLQEELRTSLAEALYMAPEDVDLNRSFTELGLDSIVGVEWVKVLNRQYGADILATQVYDYPTVSELARYLNTQLSTAQTVAVSENPGEAVAAASAAAVAATSTTSHVSPESLQQQLRDSLAEALYMAPADIDMSRSFSELGLDSIVGVEWVKAINRLYGTDLKATRVYDYPCIKDLASFLVSELQVNSTIDTAEVSASEAPAPAAPEQPAPIAAAFGAGAGRFQHLRFIDFEPKYTQRFKTLYFYSAEAEGDFHSEGEFRVQWRISPDNNICLREHVVFGEHLLPTDAYVELVHTAYRTYFSVEKVCLKDIAIVSPLLGEKGRDTFVRVIFRTEEGGLTFFVRSSPVENFTDDQLHMQGRIAPDNGDAASRYDATFTTEATLAKAEIPTNVGTCYAPLETLRFGESSALGQIHVAKHDYNFLVSPFVFYGGLCTVINYAAWLAGQHYGVSDDQFLPHRIGQIALHGPLDRDDYSCYAELRKLERDSVEFYFEIVDAERRPVATVESIGLRRVARETIQRGAAAARVHRSGRADRTASHVNGKAEEKIAIIGMSCRYPKSENVQAFWENLQAGRDCIVEVPPERWTWRSDWYDPNPQNPDTSYSKWGGLLDRIDEFDSLFFGISPADAELTDPQQRVFLEECWKAIESAGYAPGDFSDRACGVYVGCAMGDYDRVLTDGGQDTAGAAFMGTSTAILAARIAYHLNLKGPAMAVDTACSSSLVALHLACESIRTGESELALAGGINLLATPLGHILTSQVGMLSPTGRCATFDAAADGIVFSEGCGVLLLKSLSAAERDKDEILGVIQGSGINQDGKTNGITAPSSNSQQRLLRQIYDRFNIDPQRIGYVEAHGTATPLGDPIEVNALSSVLGRQARGEQRCALGSVKSNIGHTGFAAGVAGVIKTLLCIKHRKLVPSIHYAEPNPHIDLEQSPFYINTDYREWASDQPCMATVSSFGFSGTNAHVVVEEHVVADQPVVSGGSDPNGKVLVPLSAKAPEQLEQQARNLLDFIRAQEQPLDLSRVAYTLQVGRDHMDYRLSFIVGSAEELAEKLQEWLSGCSRGGTYSGRVARNDDMLGRFAADAEMRAVFARWVAQKNLVKLADLWVRGMDMDWEGLYGEARPRRMTLPSYPFARERCWVTALPSPGRAAPAATLHPMLHRNVSDLSQQRYASAFTGDEFFLADHRVNGDRVLPAVAYLEMARAALLDAMPATAVGALELHHLIFAQPLVVNSQTSVEVSVFPEEGDELGFEVVSPDPDGGNERLHCQGSGIIVPGTSVRDLELDQLRARMSQANMDGAELYPMFAAMGLHYGPAFQAIVRLHRGAGELLVELLLPEGARGGDFALHPSLMDSALQGSIGLAAGMDAGAGTPSLPFAVDRVAILSNCTEKMVAWVRWGQGNAAGSSGLDKVDIDLCDTRGRVCVQMHGFSSRPMKGTASFDDARYESIITGILNNEISTEEAVELG